MFLGGQVTSAQTPAWLFRKHQPSARPEIMDVKDRRHRSLTRGRCGKECRYTSSSLDSEDCRVPTQKSYSSSETLKAYDHDSRVHYGNRVTDLVHRESDEFPRQGRWSWPHWGSELSYLLALLLIDDWGWWKQGAKQACIKSPFKLSLREQSSCPPMSDSRSQKGLFCPRHFNSLTVCWLLLETYQGRFWSDVTKSRPLAPWGISLWPWWIAVPRNMELSVIFKPFSLKLRHKPLRVQISPGTHIELLGYILFEQIV